MTDGPCHCPRSSGPPALDFERFALGPATLSGDKGRRDYRFAETFAGFQGHFPGNPVLPAVVQIMLTAATIAQTRPGDLTMTSVLSAKFRRMVKPDETVTLSWSSTRRANALSCRCRLTCGDEPVAAFTLVFQEGD